MKFEGGGGGPGAPRPISLSASTEKVLLLLQLEICLDGEEGAAAGGEPKTSDSAEEIRAGVSVNTSG